MESKKVSDSKIEITIQEEAPSPKTTSYEYGFLIYQRASIIKQANDFLDARKKELDEIDVLLAECDKLGISSGKMSEKLK